MSTSRFFFEYPQYFALLLFIPIVIALMVASRFLFKRTQKVPFSSLILIEKYKSGMNILPQLIKYGLLGISLILFTIALATPKYESEVKKSRGSVVLVIDTSISMLAEDLSPTRLDVEREVGIDFVEGLPDDTAIGLIFFNGNVSTQNQLTNDKDDVLNSLNRLDTQDVDYNTAIGDAIDEALTLLEEVAQENEEQVNGNVILLTDGESTFGEDPLEVVNNKYVGTAVKIFTVGIGTNQTVTIEFTDPESGEPFTGDIGPLQEDQLREIASSTGGEFFRADQQDTFQSILDSITDNSLTFTEEIVRNLWYYFALTGLITFLLLIILFAS